MNSHETPQSSAEEPPEPGAVQRVFLCLGSNLGQREMLLDEAVSQIAELPGVSMGRASRVLETKPYGKTEQADFLNQVVEIFTGMEEHLLLEQLLEIEGRLGRVRAEKWGPRLIDIDIMLIDNLICRDERLTVPHPDFHNRAFALELLCELEPGLWHPVLNKTMQELLNDLNQGGIK